MEGLPQGLAMEDETGELHAFKICVPGRAFYFVADDNEAKEVTIG